MLFGRYTCLEQHIFPQELTMFPFLIPAAFLGAAYYVSRENYSPKYGGIHPMYGGGPRSFPQTGNSPLSRHQLASGDPIYGAHPMYGASQTESHAKAARLFGSSALKEGYEMAQSYPRFFSHPSGGHSSDAAVTVKISGSSPPKSLVSLAAKISDHYNVHLKVMPTGGDATFVFYGKTLPGPSPYRQTTPGKIRREIRRELRKGFSSDEFGAFDDEYEDEYGADDDDDDDDDEYGALDSESLFEEEEYGAVVSDRSDLFFDGQDKLSLFSTHLDGF